mmetsp:Transcript_693/g.1061  ORF Transcript_693/g.1061 Transcript_693/m.1061 type:complete len:104 (-) Transcript_693:57-368(-)
MQNSLHSLFSLILFVVAVWITRCEDAVPTDLEGIYKHLDSDQNSKLSYEEVEKILDGGKAPATDEQRDQLQLAFKKVDADENGWLNLQELATLGTYISNPQEL